jgi:hypothetical protein
LDEQVYITFFENSSHGSFGKNNKLILKALSNSITTATQKTQGTAILVQEEHQEAGLDTTS